MEVKQYKYYIGSMIMMAFLFASAFLLQLEPLHSFSLRFNDTNFALQDKNASKDVVFIAVDEKSVNAFGRWPWSRDIIAKAVNNLDESTVLIFDMVFSEESDKDAVLAQSIDNQGNNICGFFLRHKATQTLSSAQSDAICNASLERLSPQLNSDITFIEASEAEVNVEKIIRACTLSATFSTLRDSDQLLRKYPVAFSFKGEVIPSMGTQALRLFENKDITYDDHHFSIAEHHFSTDANGFARLNYYPLESYVTYSFKDLYDNKLLPQQLQNKIVILGLSEIGLGDIRVTPLGQIPGPLVHHTFISNVLNDELLHENSLLSYASVLFFLTLPLIWMFINTLFKRLSVYLLLYSLFFISSKVLYLYTNLYLDTFYPLIALLFSAMVSESLLYKIQEKQIGFIKNAFSTYLSPQLLEKLLLDPSRLALGGEKRELTIFFSDIRDFTSTSERMQAEKLTQYLNRYFTPMSDIVTEHNGMVDKYIGDALMAFYNAPVDVETHAADACKAALEMVQVLENLNKTFVKEGLPPIKIGIGINTDEVVVGNMGSEKRFNYTAIGDGVNLASRVEGLNKRFGTTILITEKTLQQLDETFLTRPLEPIIVKGKSEAVIVYELLENTETNRIKVERFSQALVLYEEHDRQKALEAFRLLVEDDPVCQYFITKIEVDVSQ